ncbi:MAG TPA: hypothetical protein VM536_07140 [Chloroflexia bacterium]|nr:hypothetical protein [Chloroflexia bacterium]
MTEKTLMRRRPGQKGCCGCWLGAVLGLGALVLTGGFTLRRHLQAARDR